MAPGEETRTAPSVDRARRKGPLEAQLSVIWPMDLAVTWSLGPQAAEIGRGEGGGFRLEGSTVSRRHAAIEWADGAHRVRDLDSRNGTRVNGKMIGAEGAALADQDVLRIGDVLAVYEVGRPVVEPLSVRGIPCVSITMARCLVELERAARDPAPVLLIGETGTGKEHLAQEVHRLSGRRGTCLAVNCAELAPQLIESQLFGHEKGAFTGALSSEPGLFRAAQGGSLFLDEVGELPLELQPKLLRVLQEGEVRSVGGVKPEKIDTRVLAATNVDLAGRVEEDRFRRDLYARLSLWEIHVPPLRARRVDLFAWLALLHQRWAERRSIAGPQPLELDADASEALLIAPWPDNLRGLDRVVHRLARPEPRDPVRRDEIEPLLQTARPASAGPRPPAAAPARQAEAEDAQPKPPPPATKEELEAVMAQLGGSVRAVAKHYGRDRRQIYRWLKSFGLRGADEEE